MTWEPFPDPDRSTRHLDQVLGRLQQRLGLARPDTLRELERHWPSVVGAALARQCRVESLRHGELVVATHDPAVAQHLQWSATDLVGAVNSVCGEGVATSLSVRVRARPGDGRPG